jgi:arylsulfatase
LSAAGPFDRWPTGKGFDYWYGFQGGEASQWHTPLFENTAPIEPPHDNPNWHFSEAIAEKAISWISQQKAGAPEKPFFVYFAPGACHSPHHVAKEWATSTRGSSITAGIASGDHHGEPEGARASFPRTRRSLRGPTPSRHGIPVGRRETALRRMQEVFAGFLEHVDAQVGKVVDAIERMGLRDDTLIIYVVGDNGPSGEGSLTGTLNNMKTQLGCSTMCRSCSSTSTSSAARCTRTTIRSAGAGRDRRQFQWMKQVASHFGGTRNGLVMSWPKGITDPAACGRSSTIASTSRRRSSKSPAFRNRAR